MQVIKPDIRDYKNKLRLKYKGFRTSLPAEKKTLMDDQILKKIISLKSYKESDLVITFVSTAIEVDTHKLIEYSLKAGKKVAVPKCITGTRFMKFYYIKSLQDLEPGTFSVLEPNTEKCQEVTDFNNSICITPGLAFDLSGYRLGYVKGYYDRFLSKYPCKTIGICYCGCTKNKLITGKYDCAVDLLITEKYILRTNNRRIFNGQK